MERTALDGFSPKVESKNQRAAFPGKFWEKNKTSLAALGTLFIPISISEVTSLMTITHEPLQRSQFPKEENVIGNLKVADRLRAATRLRAFHQATTVTVFATSQNLAPSRNIKFVYFRCRTKYLEAFLHCSGCEVSKSGNAYPNHVNQKQGNQVYTYNGRNNYTRLDFTPQSGIIFTRIRYYRLTVCRVKIPSFIKINNLTNLTLRDRNNRQDWIMAVTDGNENFIPIINPIFTDHFVRKKSWRTYLSFLNL